MTAHHNSPFRTSDRRDSTGKFEEKLSTNQGAAGAEQTGQFNMDAVVRDLITDSIKRSGLKREVIAERLALLLGRPVTVRMLNAFTADSSEDHRFPAAWLPALCEVTGDERLLAVLAVRAGFLIMELEKIPVIQLGEKLVARKAAQREIHDLLDQAVTGRRAS